MRRKTMMPHFAAACLPISAFSGQMTTSRRSLRLSTDRHARRIQTLVAESPTAVGYTALAEHDKSPGIYSAAGSTAEHGKSLGTFGSSRIIKGHGKAPIGFVIASIACDMATAVHRDVRGHRPTA